MSLIAAAGEIQGWPVSPTQAEIEEDQRVRRDWSRLRAAWNGGGA